MGETPKLVNAVRKERSLHLIGPCLFISLLDIFQQDLQREWEEDHIENPRYLL